ncbi:hypothetical protein PoB_003216600 [Plakobranchus ocellatus]|uniref:Uncharacterized protein n=1 Tax=Plakobranchus ocellatus TaxID=259542 RepID=A0AAV4ABE4_9GAST|nr:hypothetical protein PoB_003216600 [Plakobranchus ocellatus]
MEKGNRGELIYDSTILEEHSNGEGCKLGSTIGSEFITTLFMTKIVYDNDKSSSIMRSLLNDLPVTVSDNLYQVVVALMVKIISYNALKWVRRHHQGCWGCAGLGACHAVASLALSSHVYDGLSYSGPEKTGFHLGAHICDALVCRVKTLENTVSK